MENKQRGFAVVVATKGRSYSGPTLKRLMNLPAGMPVYVYTDENEAAAYREAYPDFTIVPHNKKDIVQIRAVCQEHQHELNNNFLMLDDDIDRFMYLKKENTDEWFDRSLADIVSHARELFASGHDFLFAMHWHDKDFYVPMVVDAEQETEHSKYWHPLAFACVALSPNVYDVGIRYAGADTRSEDAFITVETLAAQEKGLIKIGHLNACYVLNEDLKSHFKMDLYYEAVVEIYLKYGYVMDFIMSHAMLIPYIHFNKEGIKAYAEHGAVYDPYYDKVCGRMVEKKFPGHQPLVKKGWRKAEKYNKKLLEKIDKRELFWSLHPGIISQPDFYEELGMIGKTYSNVPPMLDRENLSLLKPYGGGEGEAV